MSTSTFPHRYQVNATAAPDGDVMLLGDGLRALRSHAPAAFGGPGDRWSPETLLVGAVADCYALTFRALARAAGLQWASLECEADGSLDRAPGGPQFTSFRIRAYLKVAPGSTDADGRAVLERAKTRCIVSHSLKAPIEFEGHVERVETTEAA
jgi:organic hydroperoxide reductase OsmC/OhrA